MALQVETINSLSWSKLYKYTRRSVYSRAAQYRVGKKYDVNVLQKIMEYLLSKKSYAFTQYTYSQIELVIVNQ